MAQILKGGNFIRVSGIRPMEPLPSLEPENAAEKKAAPQEAETANTLNTSEFNPDPKEKKEIKGKSKTLPSLIKGETTQKKTTLKEGFRSGPSRFMGEQFGFIPEDDLPEIEIVDEIPLKTKEELELEGEMIKQTYINEGIQAKNEAKAWADKMVNQAKKDIATMYKDATTEIEELKKSAEKKGYDDGYSKGEKVGYEDGYNKGLRKCKETMKELKSALEVLPLEKDKAFKKYERKLFDCIFTIANKIMADSLRQKDKAVISKMLKSAAKGFRNSEYVKISLSKLDVEDMATADMDNLREIFRDKQHIEFEILKDAPQGTLILDNGSEITDAGIGTQLKMIENLGKGKFKEMPDFDD